MDDFYKTIEKPAEGFYREKGSRFLAFGFPVENEDQIKEIITTIRRKYHDARHHCYAYRLGIKKDIYRMNDDGEPSGTAGKPIFGQLLSGNLTNILVIVVRYFGGILLGTGGLVSAYRAATADMLSGAVIITRHEMVRMRITFPYEALNIVMKIIKDEDLVPEKPEFGMICSVNLSVRENSRERLAGRFACIPEVTVNSL